MTTLDRLQRVSPGNGPARLRIDTDDPIGLAARPSAEADRRLGAGSGWNLGRRQVLIVPRAGVEPGVVVRHLVELGIVEAH